MRDRVQGGKGLQFLPYQAYQVAALKSVIATPMLLAIFQAMSGAGILREKLLRQTAARNLLKACR